jgi:MtN3 and saliva related transmembrane protein
MEQQVLFDIFGWIASIGLIFGYLPQAIQTIRTRNTEGISMPAFIMLSIGSLAFICQGWMLGREGIFMLITNVITFTCSVIIFVIKIQNDRKKKQGR